MVGPAPGAAEVAAAVTARNPSAVPAGAPAVRAGRPAAVAVADASVVGALVSGRSMPAGSGQRRVPSQAGGQGWSLAGELKGLVRGWGRPRLCPGCGVRPVACILPRIGVCFVCLPGGPHTPPPCAACRRSGFFHQGLCAGCYPALKLPTEAAFMLLMSCDGDAPPVGVWAGRWSARCRFRRQGAGGSVPVSGPGL